MARSEKERSLVPLPPSAQWLGAKRRGAVASLRRGGGAHLIAEHKGLLSILGCKVNSLASDEEGICDLETSNFRAPQPPAGARQKALCPGSGTSCPPTEAAARHPPLLGGHVALVGSRCPSTSLLELERVGHRRRQAYAELLPFPSSARVFSSLQQAHTSRFISTASCKPPRERSASASPFPLRRDRRRRHGSSSKAELRMPRLPCAAHETASSRTRRFQNFCNHRQSSQRPPSSFLGAPSSPPPSGHIPRALAGEGWKGKHTSR